MSKFDLKKEYKDLYLSGKQLIRKRKEVVQ